MKRCPTCNKTFTDQKLSFCIEDGTPLAEIAEPDETTIVSAPPRSDPAAETERYVPRDWQRDYQPPGSFEPLGPKRRAWPWVLGIIGVLLIGLVGLGVALALMVPKIFRNSNTNNRSVTRTENRNANSSATLPNANTNTNVSSNKSDDDALDADVAPPTDAAQVLSDLTDIENEWTVANINADKRKLDYILADDYVGTTSDGKSQGKAEYLRTIERDTVIENWKFEDLKVALRGDRATLTGLIRIQVQGKDVVYRFTDKFVWRDRRWQAVGSEVAQQGESRQ